MGAIIWILAIVLMILWKSHIIAGLLGIGLIIQIIEYKKNNYPYSWKITTSILQFSWLVATYVTNTPYLILAMFIQFACSVVIYQSITREQRKYKQLKEIYDKQDVLLNELRQQRHDFHFHLAAIKNSNLKESNTYKEMFRKQYGEVDYLLKNESSIITAILFTYMKKSDEIGLVLSYSIRQPLSSIPLKKTDLVSLISNILANAIEAANAFQEQTKQTAHVNFSCRKQSGIWILICQNHSLPLSDYVLDRLYKKKVSSSKGEQHEGIGTIQIKRIVTTYKGMLDFSFINNQFTLKIKIPAIQ